MFSSCATSLPKHFATNYYKTNEQAIVKIEKLYSKTYKVKPIVAEYTVNTFNYVSIEMKTDSVRYIYEFNVKENRLQDTLQKFGYDTSSVMTLIRDMKSLKCTWINTLDYYVDDKKQSLVFMSILPKAFDALFANKKYYTLTFYKQPQYYDVEGRLLDKRNRKLLRKVNNETFWRINDKVCYTVIDHFR
jgi:hypothetical protein